MSGKLDQSLDQIMQDSGSTGRRRGGRSNRRAAQKAKAAIAAPTGGVQKNTKAVKTAKAVPKAPAMAAQKKQPVQTGESKIIMSNLPQDVLENDVKDFMRKSGTPARRVMATYGPDGRSRGIFTVIFADAAAGARAAKMVDGTPLEGKKIKVEVVMGASEAPAAAAPKSLADRIGKPKNAAKEATKAAPKGKAAAAATTTTNGTAQAKGGRAKKSGRVGRPKKKTADELDAEMMDYFGNEGAPANGNAPPAAATNGAEPVDEVM